MTAEKYPFNGFKKNSTDRNESTTVVVAGKVASDLIGAVATYWTQSTLEKMKQEQKMHLTLQQKKETALQQLLSEEKRAELERRHSFY